MQGVKQPEGAAGAPEGPTLSLLCQMLAQDAAGSPHFGADPQSELVAVRRNRQRGAS